MTVKRLMFYRMRLKKNGKVVGVDFRYIKDPLNLNAYAYVANPVKDIAPDVRVYIGIFPMYFFWIY